MHALRAGLTIGLSLIIALGPQNMFIIRQGLKREYVFLTAFVCVLCDSFMMMTSTTSLSHFIVQIPAIKMILLVLGLCFLVGYGLQSIFSGYKILGDQQAFSMQSSQYQRTMMGTIIAAMSFSLLNPHAVLECVVMIGGMAIQYPLAEQAWFVGGAILASIIWFYTLAYGAASFFSYVNNKWFWATLDILSGLIMLAVAVRFAWTF